MAIGPDVLRIATNYRLAVAHAVDQETRQLVAAWARAWDEIAAEWHAATLDVAGLTRAPSLAALRRLDRASSAMRVTVQSIDELVAGMRGRLVDAAGNIVTLTSEYEPQLIARQLPAVEASTVQLAVRFDRVDPKALQAIVRRTTQQVTALTRPLTREMTDVMLRQLVAAVPAGLSPRDAAARMVRRVEGRFNGGLTRALNISRTELLDAYRSASREHHTANEDVLAGWIWSAQLDKQTCPSCWVQHGSLHPVSEPGPLDHQQGRCARLPKTKSWAELGFAGMDEPADLVPDAEQRFRQLPAADQVEIMGAARLAALDDGAATWADLSMKRTTVGWRDSYTPTPVKQLVSA